ncbi:A/G-specific DNA-adenine glycosylase [Haloarcula vallismortis]|uniref:HhH-GPD family protein n=2 Tax=Haloarcula vallismortis TaxID=28442 RepID=M0JT73_HALVA|nr:base excision DNA repair protein [Haloarcula vallismortis]EMA11553.1 HhH-GPD family protein [Haloarcula vallismortis ATCC 29715]SDW44385.1 A/G-specific DNA-adenine glycosylase [Haloarcula vallismortis]
MTEQSSLPFGKTDVTSEELKQLIDTEEAIIQAKKGGVKDTEQQISDFINCIPNLLNWLEDHGRRYPWRETEDPWKVYLAEILLQRTRGDAVEKIYSDVIQQFPTPEALNQASEEEIREVVHSLGFVNHRQRTLEEVGRIFTQEFNGEIPNSIEDLKKPWRVGDYSARATQLFARGEPMALVDSNFARVIGRVLGYEMPQQPHKSDDVYALLDALTPTDSDITRSFNLAVLDLGALVCTPDSPNCESCPISAACHYYRLTRMEGD